MNMGHGGLGRLFKEKPTLMGAWERLVESTPLLRERTPQEFHWFESSRARHIGEAVGAEKVRFL